jgi:hypothetical protein
VPIAAGLSLVTWMVLRQPVATVAQQSGADAASTYGEAANGGLPVATALWDESVSDTSLLSLMLEASATDRLPASKER